MKMKTCHDFNLCCINLTPPLDLGLVALILYMVNDIVIKVQEHYDNLTSSPVEVSQYPEDKHGGYSDSVATLLQHNLITINNLKQSLLHTQIVICYSYSILWSGGLLRRDGWLLYSHVLTVPLALSPGPFQHFSV